MIIPYEKLSQEALQGLIDEFVTRDSTDYGLQAVSLEQKINAVKKQLLEGTAVVTYDEKEKSCNILPSDSMALKEIS